MHEVLGSILSNNNRIITFKKFVHHLFWFRLHCVFWRGILNFALLLCIQFVMLFK